MIFIKETCVYFSKNMFLEVNFHLDFTTSYYLFYENSSNKISNTLPIFLVPYPNGILKASKFLHVLLEKIELSNNNLDLERYTFKDTYELHIIKTSNNQLIKDLIVSFLDLIVLAKGKKKK